MLLVRLLDSERDFAEALSFVVADDGEIGVLAGDPHLLDFGRSLRSEDGSAVTRAEPEQWVRALTASLAPSVYEVLTSQTDGATPAARRIRRVGWLSRAVALVSVLALTAGAVAWHVAGAPGRPKPALARSVAALPDAQAAQAAAPVTFPAAEPQVSRRSGRSSALARAADGAARELAAGQRAVSFDASTGLWDRQPRPAGTSGPWQPPMWWQSGLALRSLVGYLTRTRDTQPAYQQLIATVYEQNISRPGSLEHANFENRYMDDTGWWGLAWLDSARYELTVRHDFADASRYLQLAENIATYIYSQPRTCGTQGIEFETRFAPNAITNEEFVALASELAQVRSTPGVFLDAGRSRAWLAEATRMLGWLQSSGLVNMTAGTVKSTYSNACQASGVPMTYTEGEMADALVHMGLATHQEAYYNQAAAFINRVLAPSSGMLDRGGVLQEPCEAQAGACTAHSYNITIYKGLLDGAVADWTQATGAETYDPFLLAQAHAVMNNSASNGHESTVCKTESTCELGMYWARRLSPTQQPLAANAGSQAAGLTALSSALNLS